MELILRLMEKGTMGKKSYNIVNSRIMMIKGSNTGEENQLCKGEIAFYYGDI